jgi:hypothetical protein
MEKARPSSPGDIRPQFRATNCTCSFCLLVFSLRDPSESDLSTFVLHLRRSHGLKVGEPEP